MYFKHTSVLTEKILDLAPKNTQTILDCTLGSGGHSRCRPPPWRSGSGRPGSPRLRA